MTRTERAGRRPYGFSILELVVIVAIVGILVSLAIPAFTTMKQNSDVNRQIRMLMSDIALGRAEASRGREMQLSNGTTTRIRRGGIRVIDGTAYEIIVGPEDLSEYVTMKIVQFPETLPLRILSPGNDQPVVFSETGVLARESANTFDLENINSSRRTTLVVSLTGSVQKR